MKNLLVGDRMGGVLFDIQKERGRQKELLKAGKFPFDCDDPNISDAEKLPVLAEEFGEASREVNEMVQVIRREWPGEQLDLIAQCDRRSITRRKKLLRAELIQVAAVCVSWCESLDRQEEENLGTFQLVRQPQVNPRIGSSDYSRMCSCLNPDFVPVRNSDGRIERVCTLCNLEVR